MYSGTDYFAGRCDTLFTERVGNISDLGKKQFFGHKGYHVFNDNFYTKIPLARNLLNNLGIGLLGR